MTSQSQVPHYSQEPVELSTLVFSYRHLPQHLQALQGLFIQIALGTHVDLLEDHSFHLVHALSHSVFLSVSYHLLEVAYRVARRQLLRYFVLSFLLALFKSGYFLFFFQFPFLLLLLLFFSSNNVLPVDALLASIHLLFLVFNQFKSVVKGRDFMLCFFEELSVGSDVLLNLRIKLGQLSRFWVD